MTSYIQKLLKAAVNLKIAQNDTDFTRWAEKELHVHKEKHLKILVCGKTGSEKSTLFNGIVGSKFDESHDLKPETKTVATHERTMENMKITVWDSPGLQDGTTHEEAYFKDIAEKTTAAGGIDLLLYCIRMDETQSDLHIHASALKNITKYFNENIWENALIVLTFANQYEGQLKLTKGSDQIESLFNVRVEEWRQIVCAELSQMHVNTDKIRCQPAGYHSLPHLPGHQYWASLLWAHAYTTLTSLSSTSILLTFNTQRLEIVFRSWSN